MTCGFFIYKVSEPWNKDYQTTSPRDTLNSAGISSVNMYTLSIYSSEVRGNVTAVMIHSPCNPAIQNRIVLCTHKYDGAIYPSRILPHIHWERGFESHSRHQFMPATFLFVLSCVSRCLTKGPVQTVVSNCTQTKEGLRPHSTVPA